MKGGGGAGGSQCSTGSGGGKGANKGLEGDGVALDTAASKGKGTLRAKLGDAADVEALRQSQSLRA